MTAADWPEPATAQEWDDETLATLHHDQPATELVLVPAGYTQTGWERHHVRELKGVMARDYLAANPGKTPSVAVRDVLLQLGKPHAAHVHMEETRSEDERSFFALMCRRWQPRVVEPSRVIPPGRHRQLTARQSGGHL